MAALTRFPVTAKWLPVDSETIAGSGGLQPYVVGGGIIPTVGLVTPAGIIPNRVPFVVIDGELYEVGADPEDDEPGVSLIADTEVLSLDGPLFYKADFRLTVGGEPYRLRSFVFQASTTTAGINLLDVGHASVTPGAPTVPAPPESTDNLDGGAP